MRLAAQGFNVQVLLLVRMAQGYDRTPESTLAAVAWLEAHLPVDPPLATRVRSLSA